MSVQPEVGGQGFRQVVELLAARRARAGPADAGLLVPCLRWRKGRGVGGRRASLTASSPVPSQLPAAARLRRVGVWACGQLESGPVPGTPRDNKDGWTGRSCTVTSALGPHLMSKLDEEAEARGVQAVPLCQGASLGAEVGAVCHTAGSSLSLEGPGGPGPAYLGPAG